jgi:hypothetical protein
MIVPAEGEFRLNQEADTRRLGAAIARAVQEVAVPAVGTQVRVKIPIESVEQAAGLLLRLAPEVEALKPPALRRAVEARIAAAAATYGLRLNS